MDEYLNIDDFRQVLYIIRDNHKNHDSLTHKQVRVYLNCMRQLWLSEEMCGVPSSSYYLPLIKFHFFAMSCRLSHEKRAILAERLLNLLLLLDKKPNNSKQQDNLTQVEPESKQKLTEEEPDPDDIPFNPGDVSLLLETSPGNF